jgi:hypothetical protein
MKPALQDPNTNGSRYQAATWWEWLWGVLAVGLIIAAFFIPFRWWLIPFAVGSGSRDDRASLAV